MGAVAAAGRYEIVRPIASGGMATVHLARTIGLGGFERLVAIKTMHPHIAEEADFVSMFLDEARLAAGIHHPNVVATIDVDQGPDGLFLVMEYVDGASLTQILRTLSRRRARMPIPVVLRIMLDVLAGLQAAHDLTTGDGEPLNLVHRDVSPPNILVGIDGVSRISDFGVARAEARISSTREGTLKGKIAYMAPEHLSGEALDRRADVYAAGVLLWEMLTGRRLFTGDDPGMLMARVMAGPTQSPGALVPDIPPAIDQACMAALRSKDERFASALAFAEALDDAAATSGIRIAAARHVGAFAREAATHPPGTSSVTPGSPASHPPLEGTPSHTRPVSVPGVATLTPPTGSTTLPRAQPIAVEEGAPAWGSRRRVALVLAGLVVGVFAGAVYVGTHYGRTAAPAEAPSAMAPTDTTTASADVPSPAASTTAPPATSAIPGDAPSPSAASATSAGDTAPVRPKPHGIAPVVVPHPPPPPPPATTPGAGKFHPMNP